MCEKVRLAAMDEEFIAIYSCILPLEDGTCAKSGLLLDIHSKNKEVRILWIGVMMVSVLPLPILFSFPLPLSLPLS